MSTSDIDNLVSELQFELDQLEQVFQNDCEIYNEQTVNNLRLAAFQEAERDGEKEELEDKLQLLFFQTEDFNKQMSTIQSNLIDLTRKNEELQSDNNILRERLRRLVENPSNLDSVESIVSHQSASDSTFTFSEQEYKTLEYKYAETKSKLARLQQLQDDYLLSKEVIEKELDIEKSRRIIAEKERDVYISAYESCLKHLEKFSRSKLFKK